MATINGINFQENEIIKKGQYDEYDTVNLVIPADVRIIEKEAFAGFRKLETLKFERGSVIEIIAEGAFSGCPELKSVVLPKHLRIIGNRAFCCCSKLGDVTLEKNNQLEIIGEQAFTMVGSSLMGYEFKSNPMVFSSAFKSLGVKAFSDCQNLLSAVDFSKVLYLKEIPLKAFCRSNVGKVTFPTSGCIKKIGASAFESSHNISVSMPASGVVSIERDAFKYSSIADFDFRGVKNVGDGAFFDTNLGDVIVPTDCQIAPTSFWTVGNKGGIYRNDLPLLEPYDSSSFLSEENAESLGDKLKSFFGRFKK